jgi:hypothetical protein
MSLRDRRVVHFSCPRANGLSRAFWCVCALVAWALPVLPSSAQAPASGVQTGPAAIGGIAVDAKTVERPGHRSLACRKWPVTFNPGC